MDRPEERISQTEIQPDPQLQLSQGRASGLQIAVVALATMLLLGVMVYGLGRPATDGSVTASAPPAQETTGAAAPQTGGNVAGGENATPKDASAPQDQPPQQQAPQQTKPGAVEDDSTR